MGVEMEMEMGMESKLRRGLVNDGCTKECARAGRKASA